MGKKKQYLETRLLSFVLALTVLFASSLVLAFLYLQRRIQSPLSLLFVLLLSVVLFVAAYYRIYVPYSRTRHIMQLFATGYTFQAIVDEKVPLNKEMVELNKMLKTLLNTDQIMNASKRQAQFLALQNQINPHFLYNTLEGIRS
ncbi:MAG: histidine kinase, partial [Sphaerochaeta sp.]|nr:histidine kinase [Sphaerochaeta sp.]